jgi:hypothetical protein
MYLVGLMLLHNLGVLQYRSGLSHGYYEVNETVVRSTMNYPALFGTPVATHHNCSYVVTSYMSTCVGKIHRNGALAGTYASYRLL